MPTLTVAGTYNVRDLGGFVTDTGKQTQQGIFLRAGNLDKLPPESQEQLLDYGVATVIDLRNEWEVEHYPNVFARSSAVTYVNLPLLGDALSDDVSWQAEKADFVHLHESYIGYLRRCKQQIGRIFMAMAKGDDIVLFHCHAGKDRTGIVTALLLDAMGVAHSAIAQDYSISAGEIGHLIAEWRDYALKHDQDMGQFERQVASKPETIIEMLRYVQATYGGSGHYLQACGLSSTDLAQIQKRFVK